MGHVKIFVKTDLFVVENGRGNAKTVFHKKNLRFLNFYAVNKSTVTVLLLNCPHNRPTGIGINTDFVRHTVAIFRWIVICFVSLFFSCFALFMSYRVCLKINISASTIFVVVKDNIFI